MAKLKPNDDRMTDWFPLADPHAEDSRVAVRGPDAPWSKADEIHLVLALGQYARTHDLYLGQLFTTSFEGWVNSRIQSDIVPDLFAAHQQEVAEREAGNQEADGLLKALEKLRDEARAGLEGMAKQMHEARDRAEAERGRADELLTRLQQSNIARSRLQTTLMTVAHTHWDQGKLIAPEVVRDEIARSVESHQAALTALGFGLTPA